jgi:hypothetical protein
MIRGSVALLTLASFVLCLIIGSRSSVANFYFPFSRFWELGLGCLLAVLKQSPESAGRWLGHYPFRTVRYGRLTKMADSLLPIVGVGLIAVSLLLFDRKTVFPGWAALVPTVGAMCVIAARSDSWFQRRVMASGVLVFVGVISYPLYLWHWPTLSFAAILEAGTPASAIRGVAVLLSFVLAWLTFVLVERPIRAQRSGRVSVALAAGLSILGAAGLGTYALRGFPERFDIDVRALTPEPRRNHLCPGEFRLHRLFNYCKGTQSAPPAAIFLGDSRAQSVYDGVADTLGARHSLTLLARGGCPPFLGGDLHYLNQQGCKEVWDSFAKYVEEAKPRLVVLVGGGIHLLDPADARLEKTSDFATLEDAFKYGLRELIIALGKTSRVVYIRPLPYFESAPSCFLRPVSLPGNRCFPTIQRSALEATMASFDRILYELRDEIPQLQLVDGIAALCDTTSCSQTLPSGELMYADHIHLSSAGGRHFARSSGLLDLIEKELARTLPAADITTEVATQDPKG